jgi:hypothetical protein
MKKIILLLLISTLSIHAQVEKLKPEFRNLSWIVDDKALEVIQTLSKVYGSDSLRSDSIFVTKTEYDLYVDSMTLWKLTKNALKEGDTSAKATTIGNYGSTDERHSNLEWLKLFDEDTRLTYEKNNHSTAKGLLFCIPSSYDNLKLFYKEEASSIKDYNKGRIKVYSTQMTHRKETINFYIALHKTIKPTTNYAISYLGYWFPYVYIYSKPKKVIYPTSIKKVWESHTGLSYATAQQLGLTDERILKLINKKKPINPDVLLNQVREYAIGVKCDTCEIKLYDNHLEDDDKIAFTYRKNTTSVNIKNIGTNYTIISSQDGSFYLQALSEGSKGLCTVDILIDGVNHIFAMKKEEKVSIRLIKEK